MDVKPAGSFAAAILSAAGPVFAVAAAVIALGGCVSCQSTVQTTAMPVIASGAFDGVVADPSSQRVYLADSTASGVDVVDISSATPRFVTTVKLSGPPKGLAVAPEAHRLYAGVAGGSVAVIDTDPSSPKSMQVLDNIQVSSSSADLVDYSPQTQRLYVGTGGGEEVVTVDTTTDKVRLRLAAKQSVEQPRYNPADGMVYVTTPGSDSLLQISPATGNITRTFVIPKCHPTGLAINPARQLAMLACGSSVALVNLQTGGESVTRAVQGGDIVTYDTVADRFVIASPHGSTDSTVGVFYGDGGFLGSVRSTPKAHAAVFDRVHGVVYAPGATGLISFTPAVCAPPPDWLRFAGGMSLFAVPLLGCAAFLILYARRLGRPRVASGPTSRAFDEEDLETARERMRALEDGIFGPEG